MNNKFIYDIIETRQERGGGTLFAKIVKHALIEKELRVTDLARLIDTSSQNLSQKMKRDNFSEKEMRQIADALGLDLEIVMKEKK